jgi:hypothetical protein
VKGRKATLEKKRRTRALHCHQRVTVTISAAFFSIEFYYSVRSTIATEAAPHIEFRPPTSGKERRGDKRESFVEGISNRGASSPRDTLAYE